MPSNITNVLIYLRKSREDIEREKTTGEDTLQAHRERLTAFCKSKGYIFTERAEVVSGDTIAARPIFQNILDVDIPSGQYQAIVVTEISRLGRGDMEDAGRIYKTLINYNIFVITPNKIYDPTNPSDLRQIRFELFLSREEFELIRERLMLGRDHRAKQGYAATYIITLGYDQNRGKVTVNEEEAAIVREIFELRANDYSYGQIAKMLNERGLLTKKGTKYHMSTIRRILCNPRYIGLSRWKGKTYEAKHPVIIPIELWNKVHQEINPKRHVAPALPVKDNNYWVELYCHECGNRMYAECKTNSKRQKNGEMKYYKKVYYYSCSGRKKATPKCYHYKRVENVHEWVLETLYELLHDKEQIKLLAEERQKQLGSGTAVLEADLKNTQKLLKTKLDFLKKLDKDYETGALSASLYSRHFEKVNNEINALEHKIAKTKSEISASKIEVDSPEEIMQVLKTVLDNWDSVPNRTKKIIIKSFLPRIEVDRENNFYVTPALPLTLKI